MSVMKPAGLPREITASDVKNVGAPANFPKKRHIARIAARRFVEVRTGVELAISVLGNVRVQIQIGIANKPI